MNLNQFLVYEEVKNLDDIPIGKIPISLFLGRFQPWHNAHQKRLEAILNKFPKYKVLIGIVRGLKSSEDKTKNPLPFELQRKLILKSLGSSKSKVIVYDKPIQSAFIPKVVTDLREDELETKVVTSGDDRAENYKKFVKDLNDRFDTVDIEYFGTKRFPGATATQVRNAVENDDFEAFKGMTNRGIWDDFEQLKTYIR